MFGLPNGDWSDDFPCGINNTEKKEKKSEQLKAELLKIGKEMNILQEKFVKLQDEYINALTEEIINE